MLDVQVDTIPDPVRDQAVHIATHAEHQLGLLCLLLRRRCSAVQRSRLLRDGRLLFSLILISLKKGREADYSTRGGPPAAADACRRTSTWISVGCCWPRSLASRTSLGVLTCWKASWTTAAAMPRSSAYRGGAWVRAGGA